MVEGSPSTEDGTRSAADVDAAANPSEAAAPTTDSETTASPSTSVGSSEPSWANGTNCPTVQTVERQRRLIALTDGEASAELDLSYGNFQWCVRGDGGSSWTRNIDRGVGVAIELATPADGGGGEPFDASALGIVGLRFTASMSPYPLQVSLVEVNSPDISIEEYNFESNGFVWGGTNARELTVRDTYEAALSEFTLPARTLVPSEFQRALDPRRLKALQIVAYDDDTYREYSFCVGRVEWLNACGAVVESSTIGEVVPLASRRVTADAGEGP